MAWQLSAFADEAGQTADEQIAALARAGLHWIDLRNIDGFNISALPVEHALAVKKKLDTAGIRVAMLGSPIGKIDITDDVEIDVKKLEHLGKVAAILDCHAVRIFSYYNKTGKPVVAWRDASLRRLARLVEVAKKVNLILYHENEAGIFGDHLENVIAIANALREGADGTFRLIFDFDNYNRSGDDVWANWLALKNITDAFHLKDSKDKQHVPVGEGTGKVVEIVQDAVLANWSGAASVEPHLGGSGAVGTAGKAYKELPAAESFQIACAAAIGLLKRAGAAVA